MEEDRRGSIYVLLSAAVLTVDCGRSLWWCCSIILSVLIHSLTVNVRSGMLLRLNQVMLRCGSDGEWWVLQHRGLPAMPASQGQPCQQAGARASHTSKLGPGPAKPASQSQPCQQARARASYTSKTGPAMPASQGQGQPCQQARARASHTSKPGPGSAMPASQGQGQRSYSISHCVCLNK